MPPLTTEEITEGEGIPEQKYFPKFKWIIPQDVKEMAFIGKNVLAVAQDLFITFISLKSGTETVYVADNSKVGDGVDVIAGSEGALFAFTELVHHGRIMILTFPNLHIIAELRDMDVNRYKGICIMEGDIVAALTGFPGFLVTVWNWRTKQKLLSTPTGVISRHKIVAGSPTSLFICECWGHGLNVWEIGLCYKKNFMMKRTKKEENSWEMSDYPLSDVCWSQEGHLYGIDGRGYLFALVSDGIRMQTQKEWSEEITLDEPNRTQMAAFGTGLLIYGPDDCIRFVKKMETNGTKWRVEWTHTVPDKVIKLVSNGNYDEAAIWTSTGRIYKLSADPEQHVIISLFTYKQRNVTKIRFIAPDDTYIAMLNLAGVICIYEVATAKLVALHAVDGSEIDFEASPVDPVLAIIGMIPNENYGIALVQFDPTDGLTKRASFCLTYQIVERIVWSPDGRQVVAAAMSAGHIFIFHVVPPLFELALVRYAEFGRGLADVCLMRVGEYMRAFNLICFSDKYSIGERIVCIDAITGRDNKFAGKMLGPYFRLLPLTAKDTMMALPHQQKNFHILKLLGDKGVTVSVKMGPICISEHELRQFDGFFSSAALITFGFDGLVVFREPEAPAEFSLKLPVSHRFKGGVSSAVTSGVRGPAPHLAAVAATGGVTVVSLAADTPPRITHQQLTEEDLVYRSTITIIEPDEKHYLDLLEEKKVEEEALACRKAREQVLTDHAALRTRLVALLEENLAEPPLHQLPMHEFNLHHEDRRDRIKQAEAEREEVRLAIEARIEAQEKVAHWIKSQCWDTILTQRIKILAIFSYYQVENFPVLPSQRDTWHNLEMVQSLRSVEMENDADLFRPWECYVAPGLDSPTSKPEIFKQVNPSVTVSGSAGRVSGAQLEASEESLAAAAEPHVLSGTLTHKFVAVPSYMIPQTLSYSFLHMNMLQEITKFNTQNLRKWFNKQFDELMAIKEREVNLVNERNSRLRFIVEELNKLSDLRGSFHHLNVKIKDPKWAQEEQPERLITVLPEECSIEPYISPSQIVVPPPEPQPKDDFRERALVEMMDGVLEKLWHEEIKKPIPKPQCMLDKEPEHFNEEDLKHVFEYERKVEFRNQEREKYRKMLHAEYAKLSDVLNEGIVKFNSKVKDAWILKLKIDSVIGQENLNLMRLRRTNLDRIEDAEAIENLRGVIAEHESMIEILQRELEEMNEQSEECQAAYDALTAKDRQLDKSFKSHFSDLPPIVLDTCYKFFKRRPKWVSRGSLTPCVLYELAASVAAGARAPLLHRDVGDYYRAIDHLDNVSNMPNILDEALWTAVCRQRRNKIDNEIRMRAVAQEMAYVSASFQTWSRALAARRAELAAARRDVLQQRHKVETLCRNNTIQIVLPAGQVEIITTGHFEDFDDATLIPREDIETINNLIMKVGEMKLSMMRKQMEFRKVILAKEWEHSQMKMKLRHMEQELYSYERLKIPKELQLYLKNITKGVTDEMEFVKMEKEMQASKAVMAKTLGSVIETVENVEVQTEIMNAKAVKIEEMISKLNVKVSEKRLYDDPLEPIRRRRAFRTRMITIVRRSKLIREVQANHTLIVLLQTELELLRLKTYPTLAPFKTLN